MVFRLNLCAQIQSFLIKFIPSISTICSYTCSRPSFGGRQFFAFKWHNLRAKDRTGKLDTCISLWIKLKVFHTVFCFYTENKNLYICLLAIQLHKLAQPLFFPLVCLSWYILLKAFYPLKKLMMKHGENLGNPIIWDSTWVNPGGVHAVETCKKSDLGSKF